jgi:hypothetical protein
MQEIIMNKIILIFKKARKKLRLARYPALSDAIERESEKHMHRHGPERTLPAAACCRPEREGHGHAPAISLYALPKEKRDTDFLDFGAHIIQ